MFYLLQYIINCRECYKRTMFQFGNCIRFFDIFFIIDLFFVSVNSKVAYSVTSLTCNACDFGLFYRCCLVEPQF